MIDIEKMKMPASCEVSILVLYMVQRHMISASDASEISSLISRAFIRCINAYNATEKEEGKK